MLKMDFSKKLVCYVCGLLSLFALAALMSILSAGGNVAMAQGAGELTTITVQGTSKADSPSEASREITQWATSNTAREQIVDILGEPKFQKNKVAIENKIIKQASRFIPFVNPGEPVKDKEGWKMPVELKVSTASLRKMILEAGFMSDVDGPAAVVPMITFTDRTKGASLRWWMGEEKDEAHQLLLQVSRSVHERLQSDFIKQGFYMMNPLGFQSSPLPAALRMERPGQGDMIAITEHLKMSMVARGDVRFMESKSAPNAYDVEVKIQVLQPATNRAIAEVSRQFTTEPGSMSSVVRAKTASEFPEISKDLSAQVLEAWQRGTLNANLVKLAVVGTLNPKQMAEFKAGILKSVTEVKSLKERIFDRGEVTFEADVSGDAKSVAEKLKSVQIAGFQTRVTDASAKALTIEVKAK